MLVATPLVKLSEARSRAWSQTAIPVVPGGTGACNWPLPVAPTLMAGSYVKGRQRRM